MHPDFVVTLLDLFDRAADPAEFSERRLAEVAEAGRDDTRRWQGHRTRARIRHVEQ